jgi:hypothetical protein
VRIERQRVGSVESGVAAGALRVRGADRAVRSVDMEPEVLGLAPAGHPVERVDRARADGPGARGHAERPAPGGPIRGHRRAQRPDVHPEVAVHGHGPHRIRAEPQDLGRLPYAAVALLREVVSIGEVVVSNPTV